MSFFHTHPSLYLNNVFSLHLRRQIKELYVFLLISSFSWSLITIFEPVYLYKLGLPIAGIALYYAIHYASYVIALPFGGKFAARFGYERSLALSTPILICYLLVLAGVPKVPNLIWLAPFILTAHKIFYWPSLHASFAVYGYKNNGGTEQSWHKIISYSMGIAGPLIGGIIAGTLGFSSLFIITAFTMALAGVPLLYTREKWRPTTLAYETPWLLLGQASFRKVAWSIAGWVEHLVHLVIWPVLLYIVLRNPEMVGVVTSLSVAVMTITSLFIGKMTDRHGARWMLKRSAWFTSASYFLRAMAWVPPIAILADIWARIANTSIEIPYLAYLYGSAKREVSPLLYVLSFEMTLAIFKALAAVTLAIVFFVFSPILGFITAFALAAAAALLYREV